ncbi:RagB/SusD family nutrient uptake outer membrane protein [Pontibacter sp. 13R65]|uniref:RagB/SusD family nutrient uptake outer membrane protein n=1 Tax=Pontibacter sp. 13R65 TaxID=3127458 RepID=UPI00301CF217
MKKYIFRAIPILLAASLFASCEKQLEEYNPSGITAESVYTTPAGIETAVNAAYTYQRELYGKLEGHGLLEVGTDIWTIAANAQEPQLATYQNLLSDQTWIRSKMWQQCYAAINLTNTALSYLNTVGLPATRKAVLEGELRFLRAWYYWHLTETFGDTHFSLEPTKGIVTTANRTPAAQIYEQIFIDLAFATENLPATTTNYGRVTKPAAEAFSARVYLTRGENLKAKEYAEKVIKNYNFSLLPNYADLWSMSNLRNPEVLWAINHSTNLALNAGSNKAAPLYGFQYKDMPGMMQDLANGRPDMRYMPTRFLLNLFNEETDARFAGSFKQVWYANNPDQTKRPAGMSIGDTAIYIAKNTVSAAKREGKVYSIYDIEDIYAADGTPKDRFHYISLKKFDDPTRLSVNEDQSVRDVFLIRLAEMYLIAAEADMKLGNTASAINYLNTIRKRAAEPGKESEMEVTEAQLTLDFILDERAREFAGEQMRWFDLKRTGKLVERVKLHNPDAAPNIQSHHVLRPIPLTELNAVTNKNEFKQNPGY